MAFSLRARSCEYKLMINSLGTALPRYGFFDMICRCSGSVLFIFLKYRKWFSTSRPIALVMDKYLAISSKVTLMSFPPATPVRMPSRMPPVNCDRHISTCESSLLHKTWSDFLWVAKLELVSSLSMSWLATLFRNVPLWQQSRITDTFVALVLRSIPANKCPEMAHCRRSVSVALTGSNTMSPSSSFAPCPAK